MNKYIYSIYVVLLFFSSLTSCTSDEEIDISYDLTSNISAAHIFDNYEPYEDSDFDMNKGGWKLNLQVLVYNEQGMLIDKQEKLCSLLTEALTYNNSLAPGNYTIVSIADFREGLGGRGFKFWNISNEQNLQDLSITEGQTIYPVVFETLGIDVQKVSITNRRESIIADIKPVTSLVDVFLSDRDYSSWGIQGYSRFSYLTEGYFIRAHKFKNNIRFNNGELEYKYSEQISNYNIAISYLHKRYTEGLAPLVYLYRALLPETNKGFTFHIQKRELSHEDYQYFMNFCGDFDSDGQSNVLPEVKSNKQYIVNMIFDSMQLIAMEYPTNYTHDEYTKQFVRDYNKNLLEKMVNTKYENILGKDEPYANTFLDVNPYDHNLATYPFIAYYPRSRANHYEQFVTLAYLNSDFTNCCIVQLLLPEMSDESFEYLKQLLSEKYQPEEEGKYGPSNFTYIEPGKHEEDSRYRIALQKQYNTDLEKYTYFVTYNLRKKYY